MDVRQKEDYSDRRKNQSETILIEEDNTIYELDRECAERRGMADVKQREEK